MTRRDLSVALLKIAASFLPACQQLRSDRFADDDVPAGRYAPGLELPGPVETVVCVGKIVKVRCPYPPSKRQFVRIYAFSESTFVSTTEAHPWHLVLFNEVLFEFRC